MVRVFLSRSIAGRSCIETCNRFFPEQICYTGPEPCVKVGILFHRNDRIRSKTFYTSVVDPYLHGSALFWDAASNKNPYPHQSEKLDPDPHLFEDDKPKCVESEPIWAQHGCGSGTAWIHIISGSWPGYGIRRYALEWKAGSVLKSHSRSCRGPKWSVEGPWALLMNAGGGSKWSHAGSVDK